MGRKLILPAVIITVLVTALWSAPTTAAPEHQCGNACGIPGCSSCSFAGGLATCTSWCSGVDEEGEPTPGGQPTPEQPPEVGGGAPTVAPGGEVESTPGPASTPGPIRNECADCVPWPYCPSGYSSPFCVVTDGWTSWVHHWSCASEGSCNSPPSIPPPATPEPPCIPGFDDNGFDCLNDDQWGYQLYVWSRVPPQRVQVDPFPRWIVAMGADLPSPYQGGSPGTLTLQDYPVYPPYPGFCGPEGPGYSEGCWSEAAMFPDRLPGEDPQPGDVRDYRIGLRWRRLDQTGGQDLGPCPPICWDLDERDWNVGQDYGYGPVPAMRCGNPISHIYETSSWGKPHNGPRFISADEICPAGQDQCCEQVPSGDAEWDMPAYQVRVATYWGAEWAVRWELWEVVRIEEGECGCSGVDPQGSPFWTSCGEPPEGICVGTDEWWGAWGEPVYDWVEHREGWHPVDLRDYGEPSWYYSQWAVITTGEGEWCEFEYADPDPGDAVRVPVIEIQVPLSDPCLLDGTCPPGYP